MLSTLIRTAQLAEIGCYALAAWALGLSIGKGAVAVVAAFFAARALFVAFTFALAWRYRSPRAPQHRLGPLASLALFAREYRWLVTFNVLYAPWHRFFLRPDPDPQAGAGRPIVLVHGYFANRGYFRPLVARLEAEGLGPVFTPNLRSWHASIERFEAELTAFLERVAGATGRRVVVVAHSMGGLGIRAHLVRHGARYVERVVTIASPHHGSAPARYAPGLNAWQMRPGSDFLRALEAAGPGPVPLLSIYSTHDNMVAPQETSRLPWARNVALRGLGHLETVHSRAALALVLAELRG